MNLLEQAILIAAKAHAGQKDKGEQPYILHPLAVMSRVTSIDAKIVAVLHDVIEDTPVSVEELENKGFPVHLMDAIIAVTRKANESYDTFIERISKNELATEVKLADLEENMILGRIPNPTVADNERIAKYQKAYDYLVH